MPKKKSSERYKVNFSNERTKAALAYMVLGESRITREELYSICGKDIFYSLKHSGYIKERERGTFIPTQKLKNHVARMDGKHFASSGSSEHSTLLRSSLNLVPRQALIENRFQSAYDIEKRCTIPKSEVSYLTPDYQVTLTREELAEYIGNLEAYKDTLPSYTRAYELISESIQKLSSYTDVSSLTFNVEIVTSNYGNRELELHREFERLQGTPQIFIM